MGRGEILRGVEVAEELRGESCGLEFIIDDGANLSCGEERVDFVATGVQSFFGESGELAAIDCTEGLPSVGSVGDDCSGSGSCFCLARKKLEQGGRNEGEVHGEDHVQVGVGGAEGGMDSGEWSAAEEFIGDGRGERGEFGSVAHDMDVGSDRACAVEDALEQGSAVEGDEGFVGAHARALAAGEDEGGEGMVRTHGADHTLEVDIAEKGER